MTYIAPSNDMIQIYRHMRSIVHNMQQSVGRLTVDPPEELTQIHYEGEILSLHYPFFASNTIAKVRGYLVSEEVEEFGLLPDLQFLRVYSDVVVRVYRCRKEMLLNHRSEAEDEDLVRISSQHLAQHLEFMWPGTYQTGEIVPANTEQLAILKKHLEGDTHVKHQIMKLKLLMT